VIKLQTQKFKSQKHTYLKAWSSFTHEKMKKDTEQAIIDADNKQTLKLTFAGLKAYAKKKKQVAEKKV
jgi:hypothetical protein